MQETQRTTQDVRDALPKIRKMANWYGRIGLTEIDDMVQESMIRFLRNRSSAVPGRNWLSKMVRCVAIDALRDVRRERQYLWTEQTDDLQMVCEKVEAKGYRLSDSCVIREQELEIDLVPRLKNVLLQLSGPARQVLLLYADGWSYLEIAEFTNSNVGTVRSRLHYARRRAKEYLSDLG
jgi:RNA polymerase sigma-70 factor (ECF subfamily)